MAEWIDQTGLDEDIVVSTRVRVARNLDDHKFPHIMNVTEADSVTNKILNAMKDNPGNYRYYNLDDMENTEKFSFAEWHLISPGLIQSKWSSFFLRDDEKVTIMVNEEDHLRIQTLLVGFDLEKAWKMCSEADDFIERDLNYAFSENYGYLTTCPTNTGTGLRASCMLHLPGLTMSGHMKSLAETLRNIGLTIRGIYGEGTNALGHLYQVSNQTTLGQSEEEIMEKIKRIIEQIINRERETRKYLKENKKVRLEDKIYRSIGIMKYSRNMEINEGMEHISNIKLGCDLGIIEGIESKSMTKLMMEIQPATLQQEAGSKLDTEGRLELRAKTIRDRFKGWEE